MHAKLALVFTSVLLVCLRSLFAIAVNILEHVRWSKFRDQKTDEFADDSDLLYTRGMLSDEDGDEAVELAVAAPATRTKKKDARRSPQATPQMVAVELDEADDIDAFGAKASSDDSEEWLEDEDEVLGDDPSSASASASGRASSGSSTSMDEVDDHSSSDGVASSETEDDDLFDSDEL